MATCPQPPSFDEQLASLESHPLFMNSLPDDTADNAVLSALQSLVHDGTPVGRYVPLCVPRRWRSYTRTWIDDVNVKKRSRRTSRNRGTNISGESGTEKRSDFTRRAWMPNLTTCS